MLVGCFSLLIATAGFVTEIPPLIAAKLSSTNEVSGSFVQTKITPATELSSERQYVSKGTYHLRPGVDFTWKILTPFEATFYATPTNYVYTNEDESITRKLEDLPGFDRLVSSAPQFSSSGLDFDFQSFFKGFDALYKEENGKFFIKAKPKIKDLKRVLSRVEAEGSITNWVLVATFPSGTHFKIEFKDE